jgi:serine/threonine protein kinase
MGVATEVEVAEAYRSLYILRRAFWSLFGLLAASSVLILFFTMMVARVERAAQNAALVAKELGQYQLETKLGEGGMGVVYRGRHRMLRRPTAIKLLHPDKTTDEAIARFEREVQLTCQLNHPNTIAIYDYGRTPEGIFFYAMEFLDGITLETLINRYGP